jgi:hypothetical protein
MKKNEIKRTIEEVVRVEYIAEDGEVFYDEAECRKYEESALFVVSKKLKRLNNEWASIYDLVENGCEEDELEIFDVQTEEDLNNLRRYLYLKAIKNGATDSTIKECFTSADGVTRKTYVFDGVTSGHEVLIFWSYDRDWFWVYNDGSLEGYFNWIREKYNKIITPKEN